MYLFFCFPHPLTVLDADEQQHVTQLLIYLLPACNSDTLHRLLEFLSTVTDHAHDKLDKDGQEVGLLLYPRELKVIHQLQINVQCVMGGIKELGCSSYTFDAERL